ncbi:MAG: hypothetical protein WA581_02010 [Candidatus Acidiferrales bacterium]
MYFLKEPVRTIKYPLDRTEAYRALLSKLAELQMPIEKTDESKGKIVVRCLTRPLNAGIWRSWADKLLFEVKEVDANTSAISISAIPNLLRIKTKPGENLTDLDKLVSQLAA